MTSRNVTIVASELLGRAGTGGAGTADSLLAVALARNGHRVRLLVASGRGIQDVNEEWTRIYGDAAVEVRNLVPLTNARPHFLAPTFEVYRALRDDPPDVAIVNDWRGLGFASLQARQTGVALTNTAFVVHCHGPGRVLTEFARKVPDTLERFGEDVAERASMAVADALVSPSAWLLDWLREHHWPLPESTRVIQYVRRSAALGEQPPAAENSAPISRVAFFGQLREGKGIRIFVGALNELADSLDGLEVLFLGAESKRWSPQRIWDALAPSIRERLTGVRFETELSSEAALAELRRPGTLAVMPSLLDNSPNTVAECIEQRIPFIASDIGGIPELVASDDRARVLCEASTKALAATLGNALANGRTFEPARAAGDPSTSVDAWLDVIDSVRAPEQRRGRLPMRVAVVATGPHGHAQAEHLRGQARALDVEVARGESRRDGLARTSAEWVVFLDEDDEPDDGFLEALLAAQSASGADAVTVAVRPRDDPEGVHLFLGDPGALGLVENQYGVVGLVRASLAVVDLPEADDVDPDWPLLARLALRGARIVSIPEPLSAHAGAPAKISDVPGPGLAVLEAFERARDTDVVDLPQLAATLAAALQTSASSPPVPAAEWTPSGGVLYRVLRRLAR